MTITTLPPSEPCFFGPNDAQLLGKQFTVYQGACLLLERAVRQKGCTFADVPPGQPFPLGFAVSNDELHGFWIPVGADSFKVECPENYYKNDAMDAPTFGMGLTLLAVNHYAWFLSEKPDTQLLAEKFSDQYLALRDFAFDMAELGYLDGEALAGFID